MKSYLLAAEDLRKNGGQWAAYESKAHCVILAGPGSGKTKVLTTKLVRLCNESIRRPQAIACITYNNLCVRELRNRLNMLGLESRRDVYVGTVHSFCFQHIIRPYAHLSSLSLPYPLKIATDDQKKVALTRAVRVIRSDENPNHWSAPISKFRQHHISLASRAGTIDRELARIVEIYEAELIKASVIDFDGIVVAAARLVSENAWILKALAARFPILTVDEYQDLGVPLHEIVMKMCFDGGVRLIAVGDPDQSIYGFTGAKPELLRGLAARPDVEKIDLRVNYRSPAIIVEVALAALRQTRPFETSVERAGGIHFHSVPDGLAAQAQRIATQILPEIQARGIHLGDVAILYRDQHDGAIMAAAARSAGLKYIRSDGGSPFARSPLIMWLEDCALWCADGWRVGTPRLTSIVAQWIAVGARLSTEDRRRDARRELIRFLYANRGVDGRLYDWLVAFRNDLIDRTVDFEARPDDLQALERLERATAPLAVLHEMTVLSFGRQRGAPDHLNLTTLFSCKGSEFDAVIIPGVEQGRTPNFNATTEEELAEERRLFYVGLTRARKEIHLLSSGWYIGGNRRRDNGRSIFVDEVLQAVDEFDRKQARPLEDFAAER